MRKTALLACLFSIGLICDPIMFVGAFGGVGSSHLSSKNSRKFLGTNSNRILSAGRSEDFDLLEGVAVKPNGSRSNSIMDDLDRILNNPEDLSWREDLPSPRQTRERPPIAKKAFGSSGRPSFNEGRVPLGRDRRTVDSGETIVVDFSIVTPVDSKDVDDQTVDILKGRGITNFTPVQSMTYEHILNGRDIIAKSRTGTGKTIAFGLPVIQHLGRFAEDSDSRTSVRGRAPRFLVVCPTRELAKQVAEELALLAKPQGLKVDCFYGGASYGPQEGALRQGIDIVVGTPGRLIDHLQRGNLSLNDLKHAVLDEADEMLNMGFADDIEELFSRVNIPECQVLLFSATVPDWVRRISATYLKNPLQVDAVGTDDNKLATTVTHLAIETPSRNRAHMLEDVIAVHGKGSRAIVFTQTKKECDELVAGNAFKTLSTQVLHGDIGQNQREITIGQFKKSQFQVLVATDVAARGIDISEIDLVVQYRPPNDPDTYVHRSGRTGRAGRTGVCVTLFADNERREIQKIEKAIGKGFRFKMEPVPSPAQVMEVAGTVARKSLNAVDDDVIPYFASAAKDLIAELENEDGVLDTEKLVAKCLAAIARKTELQQRSLLTGEPDMCTIQMNAPRPLTSGDVMFAVGKLARAGDLDSKLGKISVSMDARVAVFDMSSSAAKDLVEFSQTQELKSISFSICTSLPQMPALGSDSGSRMGRGRFDRGDRDSYRGGDRDSFRGDRDGGRGSRSGPSSFSRGRGGGGGGYEGRRDGGYARSGRGDRGGRGGGRYKGGSDSYRGSDPW